jgi:hypothetical protein
MKLVPTFVDRRCRMISGTDPLRPYSRPDPLLFLPTSRSTNSKKIWQRWEESNPGFWICSQELWPLDYRGGLVQAYCWQEADLSSVLLAAVLKHRCASFLSHPLPDEPQLGNTLKIHNIRSTADCHEIHFLYSILRRIKRINIRKTSPKLINTYICGVYNGLCRQLRN